MRPTVGDFVTWSTAFAAVSSFYGHTAFGVPSSLSTPISATVIAGGLGVLALLGLVGRHIPRVSGASRQMSVICLATALGLFSLSQCAGFYRHGMVFNDGGLFAVEAGLPILLLLNPRRLQLLFAMATFCVVFGLLDLVANLISIASIANIAKHVGKAGSASYGIHYLGLSGNSDAEGLIAFVGATFIAAWRGGRHRDVAFRGTIVVALLGSLVLIGARRYLGMAIVAAPLLWVRGASRLPLPLVVVAFAGAFLTATFTAEYSDSNNHRRAELMAAGASDALHHPILGAGVAYRNSTDLEAVFDQLRGIGVTESGVLDLAVAYGMPAAAVFLLSSLFALGARRERNTFPVVLLAMFTAELAFGDDLTGFPGAILFYTCLIWVQ